MESQEGVFKRTCSGSTTVLTVDQKLPRERQTSQLISFWYLSQTGMCKDTLFFNMYAQL